MTPDRMMELRKLCDAATKGEWEGCAHIKGIDCPCGFSGDVWSQSTQQIVATMGPCKCVQGAEMLPTNPEKFAADGQFIAAARTAVPELLDEVERLNKELDAAYDRIEREIIE